MKKTNEIYIYNDSFLSLLVLIKKLFLLNIIPFNITNNCELNLFNPVISLNLEEDDLIIKRLIDNLGKRIVIDLYYIYLSNHLKKEMLIYYFLLYSTKYHEQVYNLRRIGVINDALKASGYVRRENHKFKGFLRFKKLKREVWYAEFAPTNNILPILVNHFKKRFKNEYWLIKDVKRNIVAFYDKREVYLRDANMLNINLEIAQDEQKFQELWQTFFKTIGIKERQNKNLQRQMMPKKYWQYIEEVNSEESDY